VAAGRDEDERIKLAGERLGLAPKSLVYSTAAGGIQKEAGSIASLIQAIAPRPRRPVPNEERQVAEIWLSLPSLRFNAFAFVLGNEHVVLVAAGTAAMAVPVLNDGEMADWQRHGSDHAFEKG
jgi:hypothetical protein